MFSVWYVRVSAFLSAIRQAKRVHPLLLSVFFRFDSRMQNPELMRNKKTSGLTCYIKLVLHS